MKTELYYVIIDWAGNHLFLNKKFETYQDGWDFIYENVDNSLYDKTQDNEIPK